MEISPSSKPNKFLTAIEDSNEIVLIHKVEPINGDGLWLAKSDAPVEK